MAAGTLLGVSLSFGVCRAGYLLSTFWDRRSVIGTDALYSIVLLKASWEAFLCFFCAFGCYSLARWVLGQTASPEPEPASKLTPAMRPAHRPAPAPTALLKGEQLSSSIIENAPFSVMVTDPAGCIVAVNSAAQQLTLYRRRELIDRHCITLLHDSAELSGRSVSLGKRLGTSIPAGFPTLLAANEEATSRQHEWTYIRKDGTRVPVQLTVTALRDGVHGLTGYLVIAFDISERKRLTDSITHLAHHDALTNLPNRASLQTYIAESISRVKTGGKKFALLQIDLDNFKRVNESLGHAAGDELLVASARRLCEQVRRTDLVSRTGGDEFVVVLEDLENTDDATTCAQKILDRLQRPFTLGDHVLHIRASIGVCVYPDANGNEQELLRFADSALREAKRRGSSCISLYSRDTHGSTRDTFRLEQELRRAIAEAELVLHYQPQLDCRSREIKGVEALVRWNHPTRGLLEPAEFIGVAEESGLIVPLGEWTLRTACQEIAALSRETGRTLRLAINLSSRQFRQRNLAQTVQQSLADAHMKPQDLEMEITENILMENSSDTSQQLARLSELGVHLALDDFGTGYSSFNYIMEYHVDCLKIDRSFIAKCPHDAQATAVVRAIIAMAHGLNMRVVAEGIETETQLAFLNRRNCDEGQGYLWGRPCPIAQLTEQVAGGPTPIFLPLGGDDLLVSRPQ